MSHSYRQSLQRCHIPELPLRRHRVSEWVEKATSGNQPQKIRQLSWPLSYRVSNFGNHMVTSDIPFSYTPEGAPVPKRHLPEGARGKVPQNRGDISLKRDIQGEAGHFHTMIDLSFVHSATLRLLIGEFNPLRVKRNYWYWRAYYFYYVHCFLSDFHCVVYLYLSCDFSLWFVDLF